MQIGRADLDELHAQFAREEARERNLELRVGEEEDASCRRARRDGARATCSARARPGAVTASKRSARNAEGVGRGAQPGRRAFGAQREGRGKSPCAALFERARGVAEERLREQEARVRADRRQIASARRIGRKCTGADAERVEQARELVLDDVGERADDQQDCGRRSRRSSGSSGPARRDRRPRLA